MYPVYNSDSIFCVSRKRILSYIVLNVIVCSLALHVETRKTERDID